MGFSDQAQGFSAPAMDDDHIRVLLAAFRQDIRAHFCREVIDLREFQNLFDDEDDMDALPRAITDYSIP